jgi:glutamate-ammonia-ligase adenylyltransferase
VSDDLRSLLAIALPVADAERLAGRSGRLPDPAGATRALQRFLEARRAALPGAPLDAVRLQNFLVLAGFSAHLGGLLIRHPEFLEAVSGRDQAQGPLNREDLEEELARFLSLRSGEDPSAVLRLFKRREYLRIALADFLGLADLPAITRALSLLADVLLDRAVRLARSRLEARFGSPASRDERGRLAPAEFAVIALGKLGGEELNYSSDIDLVYLFTAGGETSGIGPGAEGAVDNKEYFARLAADVTGLISGTGPDGRVFRVDLNLRPGGRDGELVLSLPATVAYYRNWAEPWERQALIKARPAAGDLDLGRALIAQVEPLVYEPRPDPYRALEIAAMKDRIDAQLGAQGRTESDIKLGRGGIRELEFAVQALQLQRGGADPWLRQGNTLLALHRLAEKGLVAFAEYAALSQAYVFLRHLEHRLQLGFDLQTSALPSKPEDWSLLSRRMGLHENPAAAEGDALSSHLERHRETVRRFYDSVFGAASQTEIEAPGLAEDDGVALWLERGDEAALRDRLRRAGLREPGGVLRSVTLIRRLLRHVGDERELRRLTRRAGPALLRALVEAPNHRRAAANLEKLMTSVAEQPGGLQAFLAGREILAPTIRLLGRGDLLAGLLIRHPDMLATLTDRARIVHQPGAAEYRRDLLDAVESDVATRSRAGALRRRHQAALAAVALRDINHQAGLEDVLASLSDLADATVEAAIRGAALDRRSRGAASLPRLTVLGLGRLGTREMDYGSDLDLIFIAEGEEDAALRAGPWCTTIVNLLSTVSREGQLYKVDLRLRPSGREGNIASTLPSLCDYFRSAAEIWEMQSFLKARPIAGDADLGRQAVEQVTAITLEAARARGPAAVAAAIDGMRRRLTSDRPGPDGGVNVKIGDGGMLTLQFIIEYLQLSRGVPGRPGRETLRLLTDLSRMGHLPEDSMRTLYEAYRLLRGVEHEMRLMYDRPAATLPTDGARLREIADSLRSGEDGPDRGPRLRREIERHMAAVRDVYRRTLGL